jgi:hypothetical protein
MACGTSCFTVSDKTGIEIAASHIAAMVNLVFIMLPNVYLTKIFHHGFIDASTQLAQYSFAGILFFRNKKNKLLPCFNE